MEATQVERLLVTLERIAAALEEQNAFDAVHPADEGVSGDVFLRQVQLLETAVRQQEEHLRLHYNQGLPPPTGPQA